MACKRSAIRSRLALVVDDADTGVTHVIRGDDHLNNTPRQMNMLLALKKPVPIYAHVPKAAEKHLTADARGLLGEIRARFAALPQWEAAANHATLETFAAEKSLGLGKVAQPIRVAVSGGTVSPPEPRYGMVFEAILEMSLSTPCEFTAYTAKNHRPEVRLFTV